MSEYLFQWIAWSKTKDRMCDCGTVWAVDDKEAQHLAWVCTSQAGPWAGLIDHYEVKHVVINVTAGAIKYVKRPKQ